MNKKICMFAAVFIWFSSVFGVSHAMAAEREMLADVFSGWESNFDGQGYGYLGAAVEAGVWDALSLRAQASGSYSYYNFDTAGHNLKARAPGAGILVGPKLYIDKDIYLSLLVGAAYINTSIKPSKYASLAEVHGADTGFALQSEFDIWTASHTNFGAIVNYNTATDYVWGRMRIKQQVYNLGYTGPVNINAGVEGTGGGNQDYTQYQGGAVFEVYHIPYRVSIILHGGYQHDTTNGDGGYGGLEVSKRF